MSDEKNMKFCQIKYCEENHQPCFSSSIYSIDKAKKELKRLGYTKINEFGEYCKIYYEDGIQKYDEWATLLSRKVII